MQPACVLTYQVLIMASVCFFAAKVKHISIKVSRKDAVPLLLLGAIGMGFTDYFLNLSMKQMQVSSVIMLHFLYPTIVLIASVVFFHQKLSKFTVCAVALSLTGLILVTDFSSVITPLGATFAIGSAVTYALFVTANDYGNFNKQPLIVKLFYMSCGTAIVYGIKATACGELSLPQTFDVWFALVAIVGIGSLLGFYFITAGVRYIGASKAAFINMLEPITGVIGGVLFYHDIINLRSLIGCICVLLSVLFITMDSKKDSI